MTDEPEWMQESNKGGNQKNENKGRKWFRVERKDRYEDGNRDEDTKDDGRGRSD